MRGIYNSVTDIRRKVFTEIARLAYEGGDYAKKIEELPYKILPGHKASYRNSIFLERAIIGERLRLGIGLPLRSMEEQSTLSSIPSDSVDCSSMHRPSASQHGGTVHAVRWDRRKRDRREIL